METVISHEIEAKVAAPPPRQLSLPWRPQALLVLAFALCLLLFFAGGRAFLEALRIGWVAVAGQTTAARIVSIDTAPQTVKGHAPEQIGIRYLYRDPYSGANLSKHVLISSAPADSGADLPESTGSAAVPAPPRMHAGQIIPLRLARVPGSDDFGYFWSPQPWGKGIFLVLCGLIVMGVSGKLILTLAHWRRLRVHLLQNGQAVVGTITHKRTDPGDTPRYTLDYGFATVEDSELLEVEEQVSLEQWKRFEVGEPVTVLYDPQTPTRAGLYVLMR